MFPIRLTADAGEGMKASSRSPFETCYQLTNAAAVLIEQRVYIYPLDACARKCSMSASGYALLHYFQIQMTDALNNQTLMLFVRSLTYHWSYPHWRVKYPRRLGLIKVPSPRQVERALGDLSRSDGVTFQCIALQAASNAVVEIQF
jgi:hypothetical protein